MENKKKFGLYFLISFIAVLFMAMLVLCGLYLDLRINGISSSLPSIPEKDKWILTDMGYDSHSNSGRLLNPAFIGFKTKENGMIAASFDETARNSLISELDRCLPLLFSGNSRRVNLKNKYEKQTFIKKIMESDSYFYVSFYGDIPSSAVLPAIQNGSDYEVLNDNFYVRYMFVLPDDNGNMYGVCFDGELNAVILETTESYAYSESEFFAYNGVSGFVDFEFASEEIPEPVFTRSFEADSVIIVPAVSFYTFDLDEENTKQLLNVFGFNTNLVKSYRSGDNMTVSFVDNEKELYVSKQNSSLHYTGYDGGIHMSDFLKYEPQNQNEKYTFSDSVLCIKYLISSLDRLIVGGDAHPTLVRIEKIQDRFVFELKYFYNGIMLTENDADITVTIDGTYIKSIDINALFCDGGTLKIPVIPQNLAITSLGEEVQNDKKMRYSAIYRTDENKSVPELIWTARKDVNTDVS